MLNSIAHRSINMAHKMALVSRNTSYDVLIDW